jgi:uncharacterized protein (TIGR00270 family)
MDCSKYGIVVPDTPVAKKPVSSVSSSLFVHMGKDNGGINHVGDTIEMVVSDAAKLVKVERERRGMRQVDLAKMLQVKESLIHHVESQQMQLSLVFAKKIEEALGIKLVKKFKE